MVFNASLQSRRTSTCFCVLVIRSIVACVSKPMQNITTELTAKDLVIFKPTRLAVRNTRSNCLAVQSRKFAAHTGVPVEVTRVFSLESFKTCSCVSYTTFSNDAHVEHACFSSLMFQACTCGEFRSFPVSRVFQDLRLWQNAQASHRL